MSDSSSKSKEILKQTEEDQSKNVEFVSKKNSPKPHFIENPSSPKCPITKIKTTSKIPNIQLNIKINNQPIDIPMLNWINQEDSSSKEKSILLPPTYSSHSVHSELPIFDASLDSPMLLEPLSPFETIQEHYFLLKSINCADWSEVWDATLSKYIIYYKMSDLFIRPMGILNGSIRTHFKVVIPYKIRRSSGEIDWLPYLVNDFYISSDLKYITQFENPKVDIHNIMIVPYNNAKVFVLGEIYNGLSFSDPTNLEVKGKISIISYATDLIDSNVLIEKRIPTNGIVHVLDGTLFVILCDYRNIVLIPNEDCRMLLKLIVNERKNQTCDVLITKKDLLKPTESNPLDEALNIIKSKTKAVSSSRRRTVTKRQKRLRKMFDLKRMDFGEVKSPKLSIKSISSPRIKTTSPSSLLSPRSKSKVKSKKFVLKQQGNIIRLEDYELSLETEKTQSKEMNLEPVKSKPKKPATLPRKSMDEHLIIKINIRQKSKTKINSPFKSKKKSHPKSKRASPKP